MLGWLRRRLGWSARIRVRVADAGADAAAMRRLISHWLPDGPYLRPILQVGQIEIVVLHHVRTFGGAGPATAAITERAGSLTRICLGRCRPGHADGWQPYTAAELLTALEVHLQALARGYDQPTYWWPGVEALVDAQLPGWGERRGPPGTAPPDQRASDPAGPGSGVRGWPAVVERTTSHGTATVTPVIQPVAPMPLSEAAQTGGPAPRPSLTPFAATPLGQPADGLTWPAEPTEPPE